MSFTPYEVAMAEAEEARWMARNDLKRAKRMYPEHYPNV
jgi:hypothetical protein